MNVQSYLKFSETLLSGTAAADSVINLLKEATVFYSQEFKPESLTRFFHNWAKVSNGLQHRYECTRNEKGNFTYKITFKWYGNSKSHELFMWTEANRKTYQRDCPKTLDNFISYCNEIGVNLVWNEITLIENPFLNPTVPETTPA